MRHILLQYRGSAFDAVTDIAAAAFTIVGLPVYLLTLFLRYPLEFLASFMPLLTLLLYRKGDVIIQIPPLLILAILAGGVGFLRARHSLSAILRTQWWPMGLLVLVLAMELLVFLYHRGMTETEALFGRAGFSAMILAVLLSSRGIESVYRSLVGFTIAAFVLGTLTVLHGFAVFSLPVAMYRLEPRSFFGVQFPIPRTLGVSMSYGKFGIIMSLGMAVVVFSLFLPGRLISNRFLLLVLGFGMLAGVLVSQGRGVFLAVGTAILLSAVMAYSLRQSQHPEQERFTARKRLFMITLMGLFAVTVATFMPFVAEIEVLDVETRRSVDNITSRIELNRLALSLFLRHPLLGIGHGTFTLYSGVRQGVHNHFLEQFLATGAFGGLAYLGLYVTLLWRTWCVFSRQGHVRLQIAGGVLFVGLVASLLEYQVFPGFFVESVALIVGLSLCVATETSSGESIS